MVGAVGQTIEDVKDMACGRYAAVGTLLNGRDSGGEDGDVPWRGGGGGGFG